MSTALATINAAPVVTKEEIDLIKRTVANGASEPELKLFMFDCARQGVHPLDRLLHFTKRGGKYTPITSIDFMRTRAADTGEYAGSDDAVFTGEPTKADFAATVTVYRLVQGIRCAFAATARWSEYYPGDAGGTMWRKMPHTMLGKCAEGLALRKGFPRQLAGLYAKEELDQADSQAPAARRSVSESRSLAPSKPNGGDSDSRPSGAEALADATLSADSIIDLETGEERPIPPAGFHYVQGYTFNNGWHEFHLLNYDDQGGSIRLSTRKAIGAIAAQAEANHVPVKVTTSPKRNAVGEAYLDSIETLKPRVVTDPMPTIEIDPKDLPF